MSETRPTPSRRKGRAPYANGERTRSEIVEAALDVFAREGYQRLSLRQLAEGIGTSHTALIRHFGTKDALLGAALERRAEEEGPWREALVAEHGLLDALPAIMEGLQGKRGVIQLDVTLNAEATRPDHVAHESTGGRVREFKESVRAELERELERGRLRDGLDLDVVAMQIVALVEGLQLSWMYDESLDIARHMTGFLDLIRRPG